MTDTPESSLVALGTLIGTVHGIGKAIDKQNEDASTNKKELLKAIDIMSADVKSGTAALQSHVAEDLIVKGDVIEIKSWKEGAEPKVNQLWDGKNKLTGIIIGVGALGGFAGAAITLAVEYFKHG